MAIPSANRFLAYVLFHAQMFGRQRVTAPAAAELLAELVRSLRDDDESLLCSARLRAGRPVRAWPRHPARLESVRGHIARRIRRVSDQPGPHRQERRHCGHAPMDGCHLSVRAEPHPRCCQYARWSASITSMKGRAVNVSRALPPVLRTDLMGVSLHPRVGRDRVRALLA
jgi:hypothetical protein